MISPDSPYLANLKRNKEEYRKMQEAHAAKMLAIRRDLVARSEDKKRDSICSHSSTCS